MKKDMTLAIETAKEVGAKLVLAEAGLSTYAAASEDPRCRDRDSRVVYRWYACCPFKPQVANDNATAHFRLGGFEPDLTKERLRIVEESSKDKDTDSI